MAVFGFPNLFLTFEGRYANVWYVLAKGGLAFGQVLCRVLTNSEASATLVTDYANGHLLNEYRAMSNANPSRFPSAALGLAGAMGCFIVAFALGTILVGLWLDGILQAERRIATLVCVLVGLPLNLIIAVALTRLLISRIIPPDKPKAGQPPGEANETAQPKPN